MLMSATAPAAARAANISATGVHSVCRINGGTSSPPFSVWAIEATAMRLTHSPDATPSPAPTAPTSRCSTSITPA